MFFPGKIKSLGKNDRVLEIGPGGAPHPRADVLLELRYDSPDEARDQRGGTPPPRTMKEIVYYDGGKFPFRDREFDYVICSHVLEHVPDVESFAAEMFRVAPKGYVEYPTIYYEYLYNFSVHLNLLKYRGGKLLHLPKDATAIHDFAAVQKLFYEALKNGYSDIVEDLKPFMFEGFEWTRPFPCGKALSLNELTFDAFPLKKQNAIRRLTCALLRRLMAAGSRGNQF